ncbi:MAG TPA: OmpA family protein [Bryobacterales bacterium]|nr:OmpA family protein [Bryobacterales bacterium]
MSNQLLSLLLAGALAFATTGCATRRFVRNRTDPLNQQVGDLNKRTGDNTQKIGDLDEKSTREISRVDEKATAADARATEAGQRASEGLTKAGQAIERAASVQSLAENTTARTTQLEKYVDNLDNYQMSTSKTVFFGFDQSALNAEAKKDLDELAQSVSSVKKYVIEVQGFTDTTGDTGYNYSLSEKRAAAVVRYLTEKYSIPVYRVHQIGFGKDMPAQASSRREARKLSRRVEVKVYTLPEMPQTAQQGPAPAERSSPSPQSPDQQ